MKEELEWSYCANMLVDLKVPLPMLRVFKDPGVDFFDLDEDYLVVLEPGDKPLTALYFRCRGRVYDLGERGAGLPSKIFRRPQYRRDVYQNGFIALQCINTLKCIDIRSTKGLRYAAEYWAKHVSLEDSTDEDLFEGLRKVDLQQTAPERHISSTDVLLVIHWLAVRKSLPTSF